MAAAACGGQRARLSSWAEEEREKGTKALRTRTRTNRGGESGDLRRGEMNGKRTKRLKT